MRRRSDEAICRRRTRRQRCPLGAFRTDPRHALYEDRVLLRYLNLLAIAARPFGGFCIGRHVLPGTIEYLEVHGLINSKPDGVDCRIRSARAKPQPPQ
jgi:hypothetical protein